MPCGVDPPGPELDEQGDVQGDQDGADEHRRAGAEAATVNSGTDTREAASFNPRRPVDFPETKKGRRPDRDLATAGDA